MLCLKSLFACFLWSLGVFFSLCLANKISGFLVQNTCLLVMHGLAQLKGLHELVTNIRLPSVLQPHRKTCRKYRKIKKTPNPHTKTIPQKPPPNQSKNPNPNHLVMSLMPPVLHLMQDSLAPLHVECKIESRAVCEADKLYKPEIVWGGGGCLMGERRNSSAGWGSPCL